MREQIPARFTWALQHLALQGDERLLEVGCGTGVFAALLHARLPHCSIAAIDRSAKMIEHAAQRNADAVAEGRARFLVRALADAGPADFGARAFDVAVAINVNAFWLEATRELAALQALLADRGVLHLFYEPPSAAQADRIAAALHERLRAGAFEFGGCTVAPLGRSAGVHVVATPAGRLVGAKIADRN